MPKKEEMPKKSTTALGIFFGAGTTSMVYYFLFTCLQSGLFIVDSLDRKQPLCPSHQLSTSPEVPILL
jgi:hypothetical protein